MSDDLIVVNAGRSDDWTRCLRRPTWAWEWRQARPWWAILLRLRSREVELDALERRFYRCSPEARMYAIHHERGEAIVAGWLSVPRCRRALVFWAERYEATIHDRRRGLRRIK